MKLVSFCCHEHVHYTYNSNYCMANIETSNRMLRMEIHSPSMPWTLMATITALKYKIDRNIFNLFLTHLDQNTRNVNICRWKAEFGKSIGLSNSGKQMNTTQWTLCIHQEIVVHVVWSEKNKLEILWHFEALRERDTHHDRCKRRNGSRYVCECWMLVYERFCSYEEWYGT